LLQVQDKDPMGFDPLGYASVPMEEVARSDEEAEFRVPLAATHSTDEERTGEGKMGHIVIKVLYLKQYSTAQDFTVQYCNVQHCVVLNCNVQWSALRPPEHCNPLYCMFYSTVHSSGLSPSATATYRFLVSSPPPRLPVL